MCIFCYGILFSTTINWELHKEKYLQGYQYTKLLEEFLLVLVLQLCNCVNKNFFLLETVSYVKISRVFFLAFLMKMLFRNFKTFPQISDKRFQLKAEACPFD